MVGPGFYQQAEFGGESGLVEAIRSRLPRAVGIWQSTATVRRPCLRRLQETMWSFPSWFLRVECERCGNI